MSKKFNTILELAEFCSKFFDGYPAQWFVYYLIGTGIEIKNSVIERDDDGNIIGACVLTNEKISQTFPEFKYNGKMRYKCISVLCVDQTYQGKGLGKTMVNNVISKLVSKNIDFLYIQVLKSLNTCDFWKKMGAVSNC